MRIGVIGLGAMGAGIAQNLSAKGFSVTVWDISPEALARVGDGLTAADSASTVIATSDVTILSLPLASHVQQTIRQALAASAFDGAAKVIIDSSTSEAAVSREMAALLADAGHGFLDAPVSGGPQGAANGSLSVMLGGDAAHVAQARPVLEAMAAKVTHVGPVGAGNIAKLVNNMLVACHMLTTAEGLRLAEAAGLPTADALAVINSATGRSALSEIHFPNWVLSGSYDSGFSTGLMRKDLRLALELAAASGADLPLAQLAGALWAKDRSGLNDSDDFMQMGNPAKGANHDQ
ncbi:MAG: NAD(P)-dependent oxidoreductase [Paracoccus sp. (in: a-proteobacteria)]|uniref:NAD(P)-dependent oxidoreductase n=1 Tax=Paracoccus sp. TaxID=267 RepID=UPI0026E090BD|nr:NAD(P)-dependent oxidoreductase [Paracoccus sp. (in: a-proteobacteria)]MDO5622419.1 NAD(P)-dependent oxidoreductase [Paracoccus sp. (in: a-proteobacteria)]